MRAVLILAAVATLATTTLLAPTASADVCVQGQQDSCNCGNYLVDVYVAGEVAHKVFLAHSECV